MALVLNDEQLYTLGRAMRAVVNEFYPVISDDTLDLVAELRRQGVPISKTIADPLPEDG